MASSMRIRCVVACSGCIVSKSAAGLSASVLIRALAEYYAARLAGRRVALGKEQHRKAGDVVAVVSDFAFGDAVGQAVGLVRGIEPLLTGLPLACCAQTGSAMKTGDARQHVQPTDSSSAHASSNNEQSRRAIMRESRRATPAAALATLLSFPKTTTWITSHRHVDASIYRLHCEHCTRGEMSMPRPLEKELFTCAVVLNRLPTSGNFGCGSWISAASYPKRASMRRMTVAIRRQRYRGRERGRERHRSSNCMHAGMLYDPHRGKGCAGISVSGINEHYA